MSTPPLDELYFQWLQSQVGSVKTTRQTKRSSSYWKLLKLLFTKEFVWVIPNDDNRAEDGRDLRVEFLDSLEFEIDDETWLRLGCSMLEMLIGLSRRLAFEADGEPRYWFWHLIKNAGLWRYNDATPFRNEEVDEILDRLIWRTYRVNGYDGLFPLRSSNQDQRYVELWYQMSAYLLEMH